MLDFDETKTYPKQKPLKPPPGPPTWREGPQLPQWLLDSIKNDDSASERQADPGFPGRVADSDDLEQRNFDPGQPRGDHGRWIPGGGGRDVASIARALHEKYPHTQFDFAGVAPGVAQKVARQVDTLYQDYPDVAKSIGYIGTGDGMPNAPDLSDGRIAVARRDYPSGGRSSIFLGKDIFGDVEFAEDMLERCKAAGWFAGDYTLQSMVSHEFGHCVDYYLRGATRQSLFGFRGPDGSGTIDAIVEEFKTKNEAHGAQVSGYAKRGGPPEAWAEAFSSHYHGSNTSTYAKAQKTLLDRIFPAGKWQKASIRATPEQLAEKAQFYHKYVYIS